MAKKPKIRGLKKAKDMVPEAVADKAASLNPLSTKTEEPANLAEVPKITTDNISEHREQVLKGARKYIYPLAHSKQKIIAVTVGVMVAALIGLLVYCSLALYKFYQYNTFVYRVTQVVPFPIAKAGGHFVNYENYMFELRHYVHYYEQQLQRDFNGANKEQLAQFRKEALNNVITAAYVKQLAAKNGVSVSNKEVNERLKEIREQNRLGGNDKVFADVLRSYWGWSINDFKRSLKQQMLAEKVAAKLDGPANQKAQAALAQLKSGADFAAVAKQVSEDPITKASGGDYGAPIAKSNPNIPPEVITALFNMKVNEVSGVILASPVLSSQGPSLQIVKLTGINGNTVTAQHIVFNLSDVNGAVKQLQKQKPSNSYVHF